MSEDIRRSIQAIMPPTRNERINEFHVINCERDKLPDLSVPGNPNNLPLVLIHTDGSCFNKVNGSVLKNSGGFAAVIQTGEKLKTFTSTDMPKKQFGDDLQILYGGARHSTAALMEITAVVEALKTQKKASRIHVATDNQALVLKFFNEPDKTMAEFSNKKDNRSKETLKMMKELLFVVDRLGHEVTAQYVPAHKKVHSNNLADSLANKARSSGMNNIVFYDGSKISVDIDFRVEAHNLSNTSKKHLSLELKDLASYLFKLDKRRNGTSNIKINLEQQGNHAFIRIRVAGDVVDHRLGLIETRINKIGNKFKCISLEDSEKMFQEICKDQFNTKEVWHTQGVIDDIRPVTNTVTEEQKGHNIQINEKRIDKFKSFFNRKLICKNSAIKDSIAKNLDTKCDKAVDITPQ